MLHCSVREAQLRIDSAEFTDWQAEYAIEPWGDERADLRSARQTMHLLAPHAPTGTVLALKDYLLRFDEVPQALGQDQLEANAREAAAAIRGMRRRRLGCHR